MVSALDLYRELPPREKPDYCPPVGMRGAPAVRALQELARYLAGNHWGTPERVRIRREAVAAPARDTALHPIPLGEQDQHTTSTQVQAANRRLRNWELSAGRISDDGSVLGAVIDEASYTLIAPRGYRWDRAEVLRRAEPGARVEGAIRAAQLRQIADWERGYSELVGVADDSWSRGPANTDCGLDRNMR